MSEQSGKIVFASGSVNDYDLWSLDMATGDILQLTHGKNWNDKPCWSPDGSRVVFTSNRKGKGQEIFWVPAEGGEAVALTSLGVWADCPVFSPDGTQIAFISNEAGNNDVWLMDADGENRAQVTTHEGSDKHVRWAQDGRGLYFSSDRNDGDADIWHIDLSSRQTKQINQDGGLDISPTPSPDGSVIAFCSNRQLKANPNDKFADRDKDIWLMRADGTMPVRLTDNQGADYSPSWSPDGTHILYTASDTSVECHLRVVDVSDVRAAYARGDHDAVKKAAKRLRHTKVQYDRSGMKEEIGAQRHAIFLTSWIPDRLMKGVYPHGYFGHERNPHWVGTT